MAITRRNIELRIQRTKERISVKEDELLQLKNELVHQMDELKKIEEYENRPIQDRTLKKYIYDSIGSVRVMDEFESTTDEGYQKYTRMIFTNSCYSELGAYNLIVERLSGRESDGDITMTDFKKGHDRKLKEYVGEQIRKRLKGKKGTRGMEILFEKPYLLRAQNSGNRTGYGSEYNGYDLVYQGTLYGETTKYAFVGIIFE